MITPVIHVIDYDQVRKNVDICMAQDIDHVFIIDHHGLRHRDQGPGGILSSIHDNLKRDYPGIWVGINFLTLSNPEALSEIQKCGANAMWSDNANLLREGEDAHAKHFQELRHRPFVYFGGIEFKYQRQPNPLDLDWIYKRAVDLVDVITPSGPGTGKEIRIEKLQQIRSLVGDHPIAVASGVDYTNKRAIEKYANYLLVASSITEPNTELILPDKLKQLINA